MSQQRNEGEISELTESLPSLKDNKMDEIYLDNATCGEDSLLPDKEEAAAESFANQGEDTHPLFVIDAVPNERKEENTIPSYNQSTRGILSLVETQSPPEDTLCKRTVSCFNCNGNHNMRDCTEPRDYNAIKRNRSKAQSVKRYHVEDEQRFGHFQAGNISDKLREALGLGPKQIPAHVYQMRVHGYPPGWLEQHKVTHSGLNLFDAKGDALKTPDHATPDNEDGEIEPAQVTKYDTSKLISFPGYNEVPESGTLDESAHHGVPPFNPLQSKAFMVQRMIKNDQQIKLQAAATTSELYVETNTAVADMDLADDESPPKVFQEYHKEDDSDIYPPGSVDIELDGDTQKSDNGIYSKDSRPISPSLKDLEVTKSLLLAELNATSGSTNTREDIDEECLSLSPSLSLINLGGDSTSPVSNTSNFGRKSEDGNKSGSGIPSVENSLPESQDRCKKSVASNSEIPTKIDVSNNTDGANKPDSANEVCVNQLDVTSKVNVANEPEVGSSKGSPSFAEFLNSTPTRKVKTSALGTPVIRYSPYSKLPNSKCFSKQISDVIHFENLPDAVGKSDKMKGVLAKVRNALKDRK